MRRRVLILVLAVGCLTAVPAAGGALQGAPPVSVTPPSESTRGGAGLLRLQAATFDPTAAAGPAQPGVPHLDEEALAQSARPAWLVQVHAGGYAGVQQALAKMALRVLGTVPDNTYVVRARPSQAAELRSTSGVRWVGLLQPSWKLPVGRSGAPGLLALAGPQTYLVHGFRRDADARTLPAAVRAVPGTTVVSASGPVVRVRATARQLPLLAALPQVQWVSLPPRMSLHNSEARWVADTGVRDLQSALREDRLTGAGQTAAVADTGVNYVNDSKGVAHAAFRHCSDYPRGCRQADYTSERSGTNNAALQSVVASGGTHRKVSAYFDLGGAGVDPPDDAAHGTHVAGSVAADYGSNGVWDGQDGIAPASRLVVQQIATPAGTLGGIPDDNYQLFRQAYRPRDPRSVPEQYDVKDYANYRSTEDARTHNNSYGAALNSTDPLGSAPPLDEFVWEHEDMVIVFSAGNSGPAPGTVGSPAVAKNDITSGASANGRQPMASIDTMASFSSHGPSADGRFAVDLATPGQIVISPKGGSASADHYLQGTSMSGPLLTGLATSVRQYFYDGYGPARGKGFPVGAPAASRLHNPSAALVKATLVAGAARMRGTYTGDDGRQRALDGQWPSAGQGFGLVNLDRSLYFAGDAATNWYQDVWRADEQAFAPGAGSTRSYSVDVVAPAAGGAAVPLDVALAWTDAPNLLPAGTPALVNDLDLLVTSPSGVVYAGNNMNTRATPGAAEAETLPGAGPPDVRNVTERVRVAKPEAGTWTVAVRGTAVLEGPQGYGLAASGALAPKAGSMPAGTPLQRDVRGTPSISGVEVDTSGADTTQIRFTTSEPTTAKAVVTVDGTDREFPDVYTYGPESAFIKSYAAAPPETSPTYADVPVLSTHHELLVYGLRPGASYALQLVARDIAGGEGRSSLQLQNTATSFQPSAADTGQLTAAATDAVPSFILGGTGWRTGTQLYAGKLSGNGILGAFMFRLPEELDPASITGARVELTGGHMLTSFYRARPQVVVDLLPDALEPRWGTQNYEEIHGAKAEARLVPPADALVGGGAKHSWVFGGPELSALKASLGTASGGSRQAAFRVEGLTELANAAPSYEFGFNRRSRGPQERPRLVLTTTATVQPVTAPPGSVTSPPERSQGSGTLAATGGLPLLPLGVLTAALVGTGLARRRAERVYDD